MKTTKRIFSIILILALSLTMINTSAFASTKYDSVSLEMQFAEGGMGNLKIIDDTQSVKFKLAICYWKGDDVVKQTFIASKKNVKLIQEGKKSPNGKLQYTGNKNFRFKPGKLKKNGDFKIRYKGKLKSKMTSTDVSFRVESTAFKKAIKNMKFENLKAKASENGNEISWKLTNSKQTPDYICVYRSKSPNKNFKKIVDVGGKEVSHIDKSNIIKGNTYYYKLRACISTESGKVYSNYSKVVKIKGKNTFKSLSANEANKKMLESFDQKQLSYASSYGLPANISWIDNPKSRSELKNNMLYSALIGNYDMNFAFSKNTKKSELQKTADMMISIMYDISTTYPDLLGWYLNDFLKGYVKSDIQYNEYSHPSIRIYLPSTTSKTIFSERKKAFKKATEYRNSLYDKGILKKKMTDMEKVKIYYDVLDNFSKGPKKEKPYLRHFDTSYGYFVKKECLCAGRASGISQLMHLEGIQCAGVHCTDHITTMLKINGKYYIIDIGNRVPLKTLSKALKYKGYGKFDLKTIDDAKKAFKFQNR